MNEPELHPDAPHDHIHARWLTSPPSPQQLQAFVAVVDARGRFSEAAAAIGISQPGISHQINELERRLHISLLDRARGRAARLTRAGRTVDQYARSILQMHGSMLDDLDDMRQYLGGNLLVGASPGPGEHWLPPHLCAFGAQHEQLAVELHIADARTIVEGIISGELELGFVGGRWTRAGLSFETVFTSELVMIAAPSHPLARRKRLLFDELAGVDFVAQEPGSGLRVTLDSELAERGVTLRHFNVIAEVGNQESVKASVAAGYGIGCVWRGSVAAELELGRLALLNLTDFHPDSDFYAVRRERRTLSRNCEAFRAFVMRAPQQGDD